jgi:hypothetical protein
MPRTSTDRNQLVAVELGAVWPASLTAAEGTCRVVAGAEGEGPLDFASRVDDFALSAFPRNVPLTHAVLACNLRADQTADAARRAIAEILLGRLGNAGVLTFAAAPAASERFRRRLLDLVTELGASLGSVDRVGASFGDDDGRVSGPRTSSGTAEALRNVARVA